MRAGSPPGWEKMVACLSVTWGWAVLLKSEQMERIGSEVHGKSKGLSLLKVELSVWWYRDRRGVPRL